MDLNLKGKTVIVTGGSRGIGSYIARTLAAEGCRLALCARGEEQLAVTAKTTLKERLRANGGVAIVLRPVRNR